MGRLQGKIGKKQSAHSHLLEGTGPEQIHTFRGGGLGQRGEETVPGGDPVGVGHATKRERRQSRPLHGGVKSKRGEPSAGPGLIREIESIVLRQDQRAAQAGVRLGPNNLWRLGYNGKR